MRRWPRWASVSISLHFSDPSPISMFGSSDRRAFKPIPYRGRRKPTRIPPWLLLLLLGMALGAAALWYVQNNHLPARLSASESEQLRSDRSTAQSERAKFAADLKQNNEKLAQLQASEKKAQADLGVVSKANERLQKDLSQFVSALPADPRGGAVGIRTASFTNAGPQMSYSVIFTRPGKTTETFNGVVQLVLTGPRGSSNVTVPLEPMPLAMDAYQQLAGNVNVPSGMQPREVTVRVLKSAGGELVSMRVFRLQ
jgi:hypothetical protein